MPTIGRKIRDLRRHKNWSQINLANAANIDQATVSRIEAETKVPRTDTLSAIAVALGVSVDALLDVNTRAEKTIICLQEYDPSLNDLISNMTNVLTRQQVGELKTLLEAKEGRAALSVLLRLSKKEPLRKIRRLLEVLEEES